MSSPTIISIGADHAGFALKESVKRHLQDRGVDVDDVGAHVLDLNDDYPTYASLVARAVLENPRSLGILICGSAEGVCIAANKFDGIRAGIGFSVDAAKSLKTDDDGNILCVPGKLGTLDTPFAIINAFLTTPFSGAARHERRLQEIADIERAS